MKYYRSTVIPRPEILQVSVEIIVLAVVGITVKVVDVNDHRRVDGLHIAERIVGVPQEHRAVLRCGLGYVSCSVVEIIFLCLVDILNREPLQAVFISTGRCSVCAVLYKHLLVSYCNIIDLVYQLLNR